MTSFLPKRDICLRALRHTRHSLDPLADTEKLPASYG